LAELRLGTRVQLTDPQVNVFVSRVLKLPPGKRQDYLRQVDFLIARMESKINEDSSFGVKKFTKTGSLRKGTVLKPRGDDGVDADVAVELDISEATASDVAALHSVIVNLLSAVYPQKKREDFAVQPRTLGIHFRDSGLDVDLVPVVPIPAEPGYGWQPSSQGGAPIKTSVQGQLAFIKARADGDARYRTLVRLIKAWRNAQELDALRSFAIELILAHLQDTEGSAETIERGVLRFFRYVAQTQLTTAIVFPEHGKVSSIPAGSIVILDPVNSENNVCARVTDAERQEIVRRATDAWEVLTTARRNGFKGETVDQWKEVFGRSFVIEE
jgi:hypothetical protein